MELAPTLPKEPEKEEHTEQRYEVAFTASADNYDTKSGKREVVEVRCDNAQGYKWSQRGYRFPEWIYKLD